MNSAAGESDQLLRFLRHVLPPEGNYVYCWKKSDTNWRQTSTTDLEILADKVRSLPAQGFDTYFAVGSYTVPGVRDAAHSAGANSFWLDIDAGPGKPYADARGAAAALVQWCTTYKIPTPTVVLSGSGLHCYWVMDRTLTPSEWLPVARRLKALTETGGLHCDPTRTADIASVLRPPTTLNYKRSPPGSVTCGGLRSAIGFAWFAALFPESSVSDNAAVQRAVPRTGLNAEFMAIYPNEPSYADAIADQCRWVRTVGREQRGNVIEPLWYALLGLLNFTDEAEEIVHEWSWGHAGYDYDATERKVEQVKEKQTGPTTCAKFESLWKAGCETCPHRGRITTPLQLGRVRKIEARPLASAVRIGPVVQNAKAVAFPALPYPYFWGASHSIWFVSKTPEGEQENRELYPYPLYIDALRKGEISGGSFTAIRHWAPHDGWREVSVPSGDLTSEGAYRTLGNNHIEVPVDLQKSFTRYLSKAKSAFTAAKQVELQHETFGWKPEDGFLIGDTLLTRTGSTLPGGLSEELRKYAGKLKASGSLALWSEAAQAMFMPGFEHQGMAILASLAAPLMRFAPYPGTIYSMVHPLSGKGKTMSLEAATSIWADDHGLSINHRDEKVTTGDTLKSQFRSMALFKSLPIIVDELREVDPEKLRGFILTFTDGNPSKGLTKEGKMRDMFGSWQTVMLSTSNKSLVDIVTVNNDAAAASRVFEVTAALPENLDPNNGVRIRSALLTNHGLAGRAYVQALLADGVLEWAGQAVRTLVDKYTFEFQNLSSEKSGGDRYVASFLACCMVAGMIAKRAGIVDAPLAHIKEWAFEAWTQQRRQIDAARKSATEALSAFIRDHWANTLILDDDVHGRNLCMIRRHPMRDPLMMRFESDTGRLLVDRNKIQRWCLTENIHYGALGTELERVGVLTDRTGYKNLGAGTAEHRGVGQSRVWIVDTRHPVMSGELREVVEPTLGAIKALKKMEKG